jgi:iron(III) transport system substrate-binding protein
VTVEFVRLSSGEALTHLRNEWANPQSDIWWGGPIDSFIAAKQEGLKVCSKPTTRPIWPILSIQS